MKICSRCGKKDIKIVHMLCRKCYAQDKRIIAKLNRLFTRKCPKCNREITYTSKGGRDSAEFKQSNCGSCTSIEKMTKRNISGKNNPFFGKKHTQATKKKLSNHRKGKTYEELYNKNTVKDIKRKKRNSHLGKNNIMYGISIYEYWVNKYSKEKADILEKNRKAKLKKAFSGKKNPMFGKPAPIGSGNGWCGWYKGIYFRSLLEFFYLVYLIRNNIKFENGEKEEYAIKYKFKNKIRNYFADFYIIDTQQYIEIKPKKLMNLPINKSKFIAARKKYKNRFIVLNESNIKTISKIEMSDMIKNKDLQFTKKYQKKFNSFIRNYYHNN